MGNYFSQNTQNSVERAEKIEPNEEDLLKILDVSKEDFKADEITQKLEQYGFAAIRLDANSAKTISTLNKDSQTFFTQPTDLKKKHQSKNNKNLGYLDIASTREFLKLKRSGDEEGLFPSELLKNSFQDGFDVFEMFAFEIFNGLCRSCNRRSRSPISSEESNSILQATSERGSVSIIHYYPQDNKVSHNKEDQKCVDNNQNNNNQNNNNQNNNNQNNDNQKQETKKNNEEHDVCSAHCDTGILTMVTLNEVSGLEFFFEKKWIKIEERLREQKKGDEDQILMIMLGEKSRMFFGDKPALHRVMIPPNTKRFSLLYFMDCIDM